MVKILLYTKDIVGNGTFEKYCLIIVHFYHNIVVNTSNKCSCVQIYYRERHFRSVGVTWLACRFRICDCWFLAVVLAGLFWNCDCLFLAVVLPCLFSCLECLCLCFGFVSVGFLVKLKDVLAIVIAVRLC